MFLHISIMTIRFLPSAALALLCLAPSLRAEPEKILFIRGAPGTVGFTEGGSDEHGAGIDNFLTTSNNHGWGELAAALVAEGFQPEEIAEGPKDINGEPSPVPLDQMDLSQYAVIVFGSNNATYTAAQINAFVAYIEAGGGALCISDANFGQNFGDAPSSDDHFLNPFVLVMNQDTGTYIVRRSENRFVVPLHPILIGVDEFDGEGVSAITVNAPPEGVTNAVLTSMPGSVRRNDNPTGGTGEAANANDASLAIAEKGAGRIAGHFDRNTFFNLNGAGTNLNRFDNEIYARNLFNWLAGRPAFEAATGNYAPRAHFPGLPDGTTVASGETLAVDLVAKDPDGTVAHVDLFVNGELVSRDETAPYSWTVPGVEAGLTQIAASVTDNEGAVTLVEIEVSLIIRIDRTNWTVSGFQSNGNPTGTPGNAIDGNPGTRWETSQVQTPGQRFLIDFGQRESFDRILLNSEGNPNDSPNSYTVRGSHDGVTYVEIISGDGDPSITEIILPEAFTYRYLEIEQTSENATTSWWSIHELEIFKPDSDSVCSLDCWRLFHFGADLDDPAKEATHWGLLADLDGDGQPTLLEFAFRNDPTDPASAYTPEFALESSSIDFTFRRWREPNGLSYTIQHTGELDDWTGTAFTAELIGTPVPNGDGTETVTYRVTPDSPGVREFVRLKVVPVPE